MIEAAEQQSDFVVEYFIKATTVWGERYPYAGIQVKECLETARAIIALTDPSLEAPMCYLSLEQYISLTSRFPGYVMTTMSVSDFVALYTRDALPKDAEALEFYYPSSEITPAAAENIPDHAKLVLYVEGVPGLITIPPIDIVYFYGWKLDKTGKPVIDRDHIVVCDMNQPIREYRA